MCISTSLFHTYLSLTNSAQKLEWICFHSNNKWIGFGPCSVKLCSIHSGNSLPRYLSPLWLRARVSFTRRTLTSRSRFTITLTGLHLYLSVDSTRYASRTRFPRAKLLPFCTNALEDPLPDQSISMPNFNNCHNLSGLVRGVRFRRVSVRGWVKV